VAENNMGNSLQEKSEESSTQQNSPTTSPSITTESSPRGPLPGSIAQPAPNTSTIGSGMIADEKPENTSSQALPEYSEETIKAPGSSNKKIIAIILALLLLALIIIAAAFLLLRQGSAKKSTSTNNIIENQIARQLTIGPNGIETTNLDLATGSQIQFINQTDKDYELIDDSGNAVLIVPANQEYIFPINYNEGSIVNLYNKDNKSKIIKIKVVGK